MAELATNAVIDADTHVFESEQTWTFLAPEHEEFRPTVLLNPDPSADFRSQSFWVIDGDLRPKRAFEQSRTGTTEETQALTDPKARVRHMDELGTDFQVIYPSLLLTPVSERPEIELALHRSYNRWIANACSDSGGRLRWVAVVPYRSVDEATAEIGWAKDHGAAGVMMRAMERDLPLSHPEFFPIYREAELQGLPIVIHAGHGSPTLTELFKPRSTSGLVGDRAFSAARLPIVGDVLNLLLNQIPSKFPNLRWGVIEASSGWIPYLYRYLSSRVGRMEDGTVPGCQELFETNQIFVTCQTDDDLPYVLEHAGPNQLVIGSDYGHADSAAELNALRNLRNQNLSASEADRILSDNPRRLYNIAV